LLEHKNHLKIGNKINRNLTGMGLAVRTSPSLLPRIFWGIPMAVIKLNKTENNNEGRNVKVITVIFYEVLC